MAKVIITLRMMPASPEVNMDFIYKEAEKEIKKFGEIGKKEITPVAFGLEALDVFLIMDESKGSTEQLEEALSKIPGVNSVQVTDVRRAVG